MTAGRNAVHCLTRSQHFVRFRRTRAVKQRVLWRQFKHVLGRYLSEAYLTRDRQSQTESRSLEVHSHRFGGTHAEHKHNTQLPLREVQISHQSAPLARRFATNYGKPERPKLVVPIKR